MGFFSKWLGRDDINPQAAVSILSDILRHYQSSVQGAKRSEPPRFDMLPLFVLICCFGTTLRILELYPNAARVIDAVLSKSRAYYDCLWQQYLLSKYEETIGSDKVAKVYAQVGPRTSRALESLADVASAQGAGFIKRLVSKSIGAPYDSQLRRGVKLYVHGEACELVAAPEYDVLFGSDDEGREDLFIANMVYFAAQVGGLISQLGTSADRDWSRLLEISFTETKAAWRMSLLTQFDIERDFLEMPDSFYENM